MKNVIPSVLAVTLIAAFALSASADPGYGSGHAAADKQFKIVRQSSRTVLDALRTHRSAPVTYRTNYDDLIARCGTSMRAIELLKRVASDRVYGGDVKGAADLILNGDPNANVLGLAQLAAQYGDDVEQGGNVATPHTIIAIQESAALVASFYQQVDNMLTQIKVKMPNRLKYDFGMRLVDLIIKVHRDLDEQFFFPEVVECRHRHCFSEGYDADPYFDRIGEVERELLNAYSWIKEFFPSDPLTLNTAGQFAAAGADLLSTSVFRLHFVDSILILDDAANDAAANLDANPYVQGRVVERVNSNIETAKNRIPDVKIVIQEDHRWDRDEDRRERRDEDRREEEGRP